MAIGIGWTPAVYAVQCRSFQFTLQITNKTLLANYMSTFQVIRCWFG